MRKCLLILMLLLVRQSHGQTAKLFHAINTTSGLSSGSVTSIAQDTSGFIWIGTKNGLNRYDGQSYLLFNTNNSALEANDISALLLSQKGQLIIGTNGGGLYLYDEGSNQIQLISNNEFVDGEIILQLYQEKAEDFWIVTNQGLYNLTITSDQEKIEKILNSERQVSQILKANEGYWIGTARGEMLLYDDTFTSYHSYPLTKGASSARNTIYTIHQLTEDSILIGTEHAGLVVFKPKEEVFGKTQISSTIVRDIITDADGTLWIATDGNGLYSGSTIRNLEQHKHISGSQHSIASNAIYTLFEDQQHNIWIGTAWNGISVVDEKTKDYDFYYSDFKGQDATGVLSIFPENNNLLFGTDGNGLKDFKNQLSSIIAKDSYIQVIKKIGNDYWLGTFTNGLYRIRTNEVINFRTGSKNYPISHDDVRDVLLLEKGKYLVATWGGGLNILDEKRSTFERLEVSDENDLNPINVVAISEGDSLIWIGTFGEGLFKYNRETKMLKPVPTTLKNIVSLEYRDRILWIGTWGNGLFKYDVINNKSTLVFNETAVSIISDQDQEAWVSTKMGVFHISKDLKPTKIPQLNGEYHINSKAIDDRGKYYFGNTKGVFSFTKDILNLDSANQKVTILNVSLFNRPLIEYGLEVDENGTKLDHDQNTLTFDYAALKYPSSEEVKYEIKLSPLNEDWITMGAQRSATFANLRDGEYMLQIRTESAQNLITSYEFYILKPWWRRWWAFAIFLSIFGVFLYLFQQYTARWEKLKSNFKIEKLTREKEAEIGKIKQKFFINISHEIRTPLTLIVGELEHLASKTAGDKFVNSALKKIRSNANHMTQLVNELLDFRKLDAEGLKLHVAEGNYVKFVKEIYLSFQSQANALGIAYTFHSDQDNISLWYDRDQSEKVIYNLLSNAFKYTAAGGMVKVIIEQNTDHVFLKVADTGKGIEKSQIEHVFDRFYQSDNAMKMSGYGIGLSIVRDIVRLHGGEISLESKLDEGSTFTVKLGKGKAHFNPGLILTNFEDSETMVNYDQLQEEEPTEKLNLEEEKLLLIVEDNDGIREFIAKTLSGEFKLALASNGVEAMELIARELPDIIITDVMMPVMDGITLLSNVKTNRNTSHIPVIVLTARTGLIYKKEGYDIGADDYITKPFNTLLLKSRIRNILGNQLRLKEKIRSEYLTNPKEISINSPDDQFLSDLTQIVDTHINDADLGAELISKELGMSHSVVYKKLKTLTGYKIVEFVRDYRLTQASKLLKDYGFSVAEACYKVGFSDRKYFSQVFKKKFGVTPSEHIKNSK